MRDCLFCKILNGSIPAKIISENENAVAFHDISPQAPFHALIVPRKHVSSLNEMTYDDRDQILPVLFSLADKIAADAGIKERGYRCVINNQPEAGQTVFHLHLHVLGGGNLKGGFGA